MLNEKEALSEKRLPVPDDMIRLEDPSEELAVNSSGDSELQINIPSQDVGDDDKTAEEKIDSITDDALGRFDMDFQYQ